MRTLAIQYSPNGIWPNKFDEAAKSRSISQFESDIYPIWSGIEKRDRLAVSKMTQEEISLAPVLLEVGMVHAQDRAILESGKKPNMGIASAEDVQQNRKKEAAAGKFNSWQRDVDF